MDKMPGSNPENIGSAFSLTDGPARVMRPSVHLLSAVVFLDLQGVCQQQIPLQADSTCPNSWV